MEQGAFKDVYTTDYRGPGDAKCETTVIKKMLQVLDKEEKTEANLGKSSLKFSGSKIWETVLLSLKCVPYNTLKKEWKRQLLVNQT